LNELVAAFEKGLILCTLSSTYLHFLLLWFFFLLGPKTNREQNWRRNISNLGQALDKLIANYLVNPTILRVVRVARIGRVLRLVKGNYN